MGGGGPGGGEVGGGERREEREGERREERGERREERVLSCFFVVVGPSLLTGIAECVCSHLRVIAMATYYVDNNPVCL